MTLGQAHVVEDVGALALEPPGEAAAAIYDRPIGLRLLHRDRASGEEHYVVRYPAGLQGRIHRHTAAHTMVVLEGHLDANGQILGPGSYAHFPAGETMRHQAAGDGDCLFVLIFHGPFDVEIVDSDG
jgi:quercetin dioxygenase-like cupin family protein